MERQSAVNIQSMQACVEIYGRIKRETAWEVNAQQKGKNKSGYIGRLVQELRVEDKKFQPMAEAKRRRGWDLVHEKQSSSERCLSDNSVRNQKLITQSNSNEATDEHLDKTPAAFRRSQDRQSPNFTLSKDDPCHPVSSEATSRLPAQASRRTKSKILPFSCHDDKAAVELARVYFNWTSLLFSWHFKVYERKGSVWLRDWATSKH